MDHIENNYLEAYNRYKDFPVITTAILTVLMSILSIVIGIIAADFMIFILAAVISAIIVAGYYYASCMIIAATVVRTDATLAIYNYLKAHSASIDKIIDEHAPKSKTTTPNSIISQNAQRHQCSPWKCSCGHENSAFAIECSNCYKRKGN